MLLNSHRVTLLEGAVQELGDYVGNMRGHPHRTHCAHTAHKINGKLKLSFSILKVQMT